MRPMVGLTLMLLGFALLTPSCRRLELFRRTEPPRATADGPAIGSLAPEIDGEDFDGKRLKLSDHRGKVVVLVFWFSRCVPCLNMIPHERELALRYRDEPFVMLGVNNDENAEDARRIIATKKMTWPIWKTDSFHHPINKTWGVERWPAVFVIDAKGVLRYARVMGPALDHAVETLLAEAKKK